MNLHMGLTGSTGCSQYLARWGEPIGHGSSPSPEYSTRNLIQRLRRLRRTNGMDKRVVGPVSRQPHLDAAGAFQWVSGHLQRQGPIARIAGAGSDRSSSTAKQLFRSRLVVDQQVSNGSVYRSTAKRHAVVRLPRLREQSPGSSSPVHLHDWVRLQALPDRKSPFHDAG